MITTAKQTKYTFYMALGATIITSILCYGYIRYLQIDPILADNWFGFSMRFFLVLGIIQMLFVAIVNAYLSQFNDEYEVFTNKLYNAVAQSMAFLGIYAVFSYFIFLLALIFKITG